MKKVLSVIFCCIVFISCTLPITSEASAKPKQTSIVAVSSPNAKQIKIKWKTIKGVSGYQIKLTTKSKSGNSTVSVSTNVNIKKPNYSSKTVKGLKSNRKYLIKIRTYKNVDGKKVYSDWSKSKTVKTKKVKKTPTIKNGVLKVVTSADFPPYEYYENGKLVGIDIEIAKAIAKRLGLKLKVYDTEFDATISSVSLGKYDMCISGITSTYERRKIVDFSKSYYTGTQVMLVNNNSRIKSIDDVSKKHSIGAVVNTTSSIYIADDYNNNTIINYDNARDAALALLSNKIDCMFTDESVAYKIVNNNDGITINDDPYVVEHYAICFNDKNDKLRKKVNSVLKELKKDGTIKKIVNKYIHY